MQTGELSLTALLALADVSGESGTSEVEGVHEEEGSSTSSTTGGHVTKEEHEGLGLGVVWAEPLLEVILKSEVHGLSGEVSDHIGGVASPEGDEALLLVHSREAVTNALVLVFSSHVLVGVLDLQKHLNSLNRSDHSLRDGGGNTTDQKVLEEMILSNCATFTHGISLFSFAIIYNDNHKSLFNT